jgi:hypothetical protein
MIKFRLLVSLIASMFFFIGFILEHIIYNKFLYAKEPDVLIENFTPRINGFVRPHIRTARIKMEELTEDTNTFFNRIIRHF